MGLGQSSFAVPIPNVEFGGSPTFGGTYDPISTNNNTLSHSICGIGNDCDAADAGANTDTWQLAFANDGIMSLSISAVTLPLVNRFDVFTLVVKDAAGITIATFPPLAPNPIAIFATAAGQFYTIVVSWSITDALQPTPTRGGHRSTSRPLRRFRNRARWPCWASACLASAQPAVARPETRLRPGAAPALHTKARTQVRAFFVARDIHRHVPMTPRST